MYKVNVYEAVTDRIINALENGIVPWKTPWNSKLPQNFISKKAYRGINTLLLSLSNYHSPYWMTFNQAKGKGGKVRKGEKSTIIIYWNFIEVEDKKAKDGKKRVPILRYYNVFNLEQIDGIEVPKEEVLDFKPIERCEEIVSSYETMPKILASGQAYYSPRIDEIGMPGKQNFHSEEQYYATLFHEMTHSTGHESRLKRDGIMQISSFGNEVYSKEELVAELGASFLAYEGGIDHKNIVDSSASYIENWLKQLKGDKKMIIQASSQAQKAVDHILGWEHEE